MPGHQLASGFMCILCIMCMYYVVNRLPALYRPVGHLLGPIWV